MEEENEYYYSTNVVGGIIKRVAIYEAVIGIIVSVILGIIMESFLIAFFGTMATLLSGLFLYAIGELIQILHDLRTNLEHIRDYFEDNEEQK